MSHFEKRVNEVIDSGKFKNRKAWCLAAGVAVSYIARQITRYDEAEKAGKPPKVIGRLEDLSKLAAAAKVTVEWLTGMPVAYKNLGQLGVDEVVLALHRPGLKEARKAHPDAPMLAVMHAIKEADRLSISPTDAIKYGEFLANSDPSTYDVSELDPHVMNQADATMIVEALLKRLRGK